MITRELSPRTVARLLAPAWRFDAAVVGEWTLDDVHASGRSGSVIVELRCGGAVTSIALEPDVGRAAHETACGLALSWAEPGDADAGVAACRALAAQIHAAVPDSTARWAVPDDAAVRLPDTLAAEIEVRPASLDDDPDAALLRTDAVQYARLYDVTPQAVEVHADGVLPIGVSVHHPAPANGAQPPSGSLYPVPLRFHRRAFRRYFGALGCAYLDGVPRTVPTPATFERAVRRALGRGPALVPCLERGRRPSTEPERWAARVAEHVLPIGVAPRWAVELHRQLRRSERLSRVPVDVGMLAHDMSLHALGLHAIPKERWEALAWRARERLRTGGRSAARRVAELFESTVTKAAWDAWNEAETPDAFAAAFERRFDALEDAFARA